MLRRNMRPRQRPDTFQRIEIMATRTPAPKKKAGPKAAPKTIAKAAPKAPVEAIEAETVKVETVEVEPKVVPLAAAEEAAAVETPVEIPVKTAPATETPAAAKGYDDFVAVQKDGVDAFVKAGEVFAKGAEELGKACFDLAQESAAANAEAVSAMLAAKSVDELVALQNELARKAFDRSIAESTRISEMSMKIANEALEPIQTQVTVAVEKALKPLAA